MELSGQHRRKLQDTLIKAFPTLASLEQMLSHQLDKNLRAIAGEGSLEDIVFRLIQAANAEGWVDKLIAGARKSNSENQPLLIFAEEFNNVTKKNQITTNLFKILLPLEEDYIKQFEQAYKECCPEKLLDDWGGEILIV